jgi:hypothetical protein
MTLRRSRGSKVTIGRTPWWVGAAALGAVLGIGFNGGSPWREDRVPEVWTVLVQTGDELASDPHSPRLAAQPLTARKAYLLAFHQAQDVSDLEHMLFVADRLDAAGELEIAAHVRRAADALRQELGP